MKICCYSGSLTALLISIKLVKIQNLTFVNKLFILYFLLDSILGSLEMFFLFKLFEEQDLEDDVQTANCTYFITTWIVCVNRAIFHTFFIFCRLMKLYVERRSCILYRSAYVKYAHGLLKDGLHILHIVVMSAMLLVTSHTLLLWPSRVLFDPEFDGYQSWMKGKFCMKTSISQEYFDTTSLKPKMITMSFSTIHILMIFSCFVSASRAKY